MYDVVIIGAGPAGISASLYTQRANLKTLVLYQDESALEKTNQIENYYGFEKGISGTTLYETGKKQAEALGITLKQQEVINVIWQEKEFKVITSSEEYETKTVILATGNKKNRPKIEGIERLEGKGISYCAICDGFFYRNKDVAVIGNGNYAIFETMDLLGTVKSVTILTNGKEMPEYRAEKVKINNKKIEKIEGTEKVEAIQFKDKTKLKIDGIFVAEGVAGSTEFAKKLGIFTQKDKIIVNENMETNLKGLYACGDCTGGLLQISKAVYEGTKAGLQAIQYCKTKIKEE